MINLSNLNTESSFTLPDNGNFEIVQLKGGVYYKGNQAIPFRLTALQFTGKNRAQRRREAKLAKLNRKTISLPPSQSDTEQLQAVA